MPTQRDPFKVVVFFFVCLFAFLMLVAVLELIVVGIAIEASKPPVVYTSPEELKPAPSPPPAAEPIPQRRWRRL